MRVLLLAFISISNSNPSLGNPTNLTDFDLLFNGTKDHLQPPTTSNIDTPKPYFNAETDVFFQLYTNKNPKEPFLLYNERSAFDSHFNRSHPTRVIIHGWKNNGNSPVNILIRDAYLSRGDFNVIVVDWGLGADALIYYIARDRCPFVGDRVAKMLQQLAATHDIDLAKVTIIGHSLGAHVAALVGRSLNENDGSRLGSIVGLDPAKLKFSTVAVAPFYPLVASDALYVQKIRTSTLGIWEDNERANFYPNRGSQMPGCGLDTVCDHSKAYEYFAKSINQRLFVAENCKRKLFLYSLICFKDGVDRYMGGEPLDRRAKGIYYLKIK